MATKKLTHRFTNCGQQYRTDKATMDLINQFIRERNLAGLKATMDMGLALGCIKIVKFGKTITARQWLGIK